MRPGTCLPPVPRAERSAGPPAGPIEGVRHRDADPLPDCHPAAARGLRDAAGRVSTRRSRLRRGVLAAALPLVAARHGASRRGRAARGVTMHPPWRLPAVARSAKAGRLVLFIAILLAQFAIFEAGLRR